MTLHRRAGLPMAILLACLAGCRGLSDPAAEALVRSYNDRLIEAYRSSDEQVVEGLVGDDEAKKILGLIGVKKDMGITLDSRLTAFTLLRVEHPAKNRVEVVSDERWHYADRRIGTGEVVGQASDDHYVMRYILARKGRSWVVERVVFEQPPVIGREAAPNQAPTGVFHGLTVNPPPNPSSPPGKSR